MADGKKTWISELSIFGAALAVGEPLLSWLTSNPIIPAPFDTLVLGMVSVLVWVARSRMKAAAPVALVALALILGGQPAQAQVNQQCVRVCDIDGDGKVIALADMRAFWVAIGTKGGEPNFNPRADIDNSGTVTMNDYGSYVRFCH